MEITSFSELSFVNYKVTVIVLKPIYNVKESTVAAQPNEQQKKVGKPEAEDVIN